MNAKKKTVSVMDATSILGQVVTLEESEELRVQKTLATFATEADERKKSLQEEMQRQEQMIRTGAQEDLHAFAKREPAAILTAAQEQAQEQAQRIDTSAKKHMATTANTLVESLLDLSFISRS